MMTANNTLHCSGTLGAKFYSRTQFLHRMCYLAEPGQAVQQAGICDHLINEEAMQPSQLP